MRCHDETILTNRNEKQRGHSLPANKEAKVVGFLSVKIRYKILIASIFLVVAMVLITAVWGFYHIKKEIEEIRLKDYEAIKEKAGNIKDANNFL